MILRVGSPDTTSIRWHRLIHQFNQTYIRFAIKRFDEHWWWVAIEHGEIAGFAGALPEAGCFFLGPCGVAEKARGQGLQRQFIRARVAFGKTVGFTTAVSHTDAVNWYSANNFIKEGFLLGPPWIPHTHENESLFFRKAIP